MMKADELKEKYLQPIQVYWEGREPKQRKIIYLVGALLLIAIIGLVVYLNYQPYTVLFRDLDSTEASAILTSLQEKGVSAKVENTGTILVPKDQEASLKMQLATEGYPKSALSYDIYMNNVDTMATDSDRKTYQLFQLQERLQEAIRTIGGVKSAVVTISLPENNSFVISPNKEMATASVLVTMLGGDPLTEGQVNGIKQLVSKSISGMQRENVSVIDGLTGNEMGSDEDSASGKANSKMDIEKKIDQNMEKKVRDILGPLVGNENLQVVATSKINMDTGVVQSTTYTPSQEGGNTGVVSDEQHRLEGQDRAILAAGVPGAETNAAGTPTYPQVNGATAGNNFVNEYGINYKVNETKAETQKSNYTTESINIGIVVNKPNLTATEKGDYAALVAASANVPVENVTIYAGDFGQTAPVSGTGLVDLMKNNTGIVAIIAGALLLVVLLIGFLIWRKRRKAANEFWEAPVAGVTVGEHTTEAVVEPPKIEETPQQVLQKQVKNFATEHPDVAAQLIRSWLKGDE